MTLLLEKLPRCLVNHSKGRLIMVLLIVVAAILQWVCWSKRRPVVSERKEEIRAIARLEDEVKKLEKRWSEDEAAKVDAELQSAYSFLFTGAPGSGGWAEQVNKPKSVAAFGVNVKMGKIKYHPRHADELIVAPTSWNLGIKKGGGIGIPQVIECMKEITSNESKRMDLVRLVVSGDGRNLTSAEFGLDLWFLNEGN
ncbi:MAG: hypothetical protein KDN22_28355 [Verrucomicrobiae bacterium]|nr:hypothetical protein [Verrucomicrobiae bacterium]